MQFLPTEERQVDLDSPILNVDPGKIALGNSSDAALSAAEGDPSGPACAASLSAFRSALFFRNVFTAIVAVLAFVTLVVICFCLFRLLDSSWDSASTFAAIGAGVTGAGAMFLRQERSKAIKVLNEALGEVGKYCGEPVREDLS